MIVASIWSQAFVLFILSSCSSMVPRSTIQRRELLYTTAGHDPCSRYDLWIAIDDEQKLQVTEECVVAFEAFVLLTPEEQESCPQADYPACRRGFGCGTLDYRCTFMCLLETNEGEQGSARDERGRQKRAKEFKMMPKDLKSIVTETVYEPKYLRPGMKTYNKGQKRIRASAPDL